jgi:hypothetical protein
MPSASGFPLTAFGEPFQNTDCDHERYFNRCKSACAADFCREKCQQLAGKNARQGNLLFIHRQVLHPWRDLTEPFPGTV